jgi:hypothetical protein
MLRKRDEDIAAANTQISGTKLFEVGRAQLFKRLIISNR